MYNRPEYAISKRTNKSTSGKTSCRARSPGSYRAKIGGGKPERESQRIEDEHKRKLQHSRDVADRVLRESGVLEEIKAIQNNFLRSEKSDLYVNYYDDKAVLTLIWGRYKLEKDKGITKLNWHNGSAMIYSHIDVEVDVDSKGLRINGGEFTEQAWLLNRQTINDRLALEYLNPRSFSSYEGGYGDGDPHYIHN